MSIVLFLLVTVAVLAAAGPGGRCTAGRGGGPALRSGEPAGARPGGASGRRRTLMGALLATRGGRSTGDELAETVATVCTLLRSGARPGDAWSRALHVPGCGAVPTVDQVVSHLVGSARRRPTAGELGRAQAVVAAAATAHQLGAPLAGVLDEVAAAVVADAEAEAELLAALSGPRASVRVLLGLPLLGVLLGAALGADPVGVLLDGRLGTAAGVVGCALAGAGWCWTRALIDRARQAAA